MNPHDDPLPGDARHDPAVRGDAMHMETGHIQLPAPTAWPLAMALGATLLLGGLVTNYYISLLGIFVTIAGIVGWFKEVLPHEQHESIKVAFEEIPVETESRKVTKVRMSEEHRAQLPLESYPISSGIKGGFAGGTAMIVLAEIYGVIAYHSIWYVVNLLGGAGVAGWTHPTEAQLRSFHLLALVIAIIIHTSASFLVGLLYGALLPLMPKHPFILGGLIAPALWTGVLHSILGLLNPFFDDHINWGWFAASQVAFGLVAGYVVAREGRIKRFQDVPLSMRMGLETPGHMQGHGPQGGGA
ncbi:MAG: hypothetical protein ACR2JE_00285 [Acidobacteriaceae bacterium]